MKQAVLNMMLFAGAFDLFRLANRAKALILTYHRFSESDESEATSARAFAGQLAYLVAHYRLVPLSFIAERLASGLDLPARVAAITIDDGYCDAYQIAFPLLRRYRAPATIFVVADFVARRTWLWPDKLRYVTWHTREPELEATTGDGTLRLALGDRASRLEAAGRVNAMLKTLPNEAKDAALDCLAARLGVRLPDLPPEQFSSVTWDELREMNAAGLEVGSHTLTHPILTQVSEEQLQREVRESRLQLEARLGQKVDLFCYPNGDYNARVQREVARAGYRCAVTTEYGLNERGSYPLTLRRIHAEHDLAHFVQGASGFEQVKNKLRRSARWRGERPGATSWQRTR
jgi:peptidoglycan/xylan/chitin deacetylase (PgdA/CDA1 family)